MRKFYSIVLMAAALLVGTNAQATTLQDIQDAIDNAAVGATVNITLNSDVQVSTPIHIYAKKDEAGKTVNLNLAGFTISANAKVAVIELLKGTLNLVGPGTISTDQNYEAIRVYGAFEDVANWANLNIGDLVLVQSVKPGSGYGDAKPAANAISIMELYPTYCTYAQPEYKGEDLMLLDPANYKVDYYVASGKRKTASISAGSSATARTLITNDKIDYATCVFKAGTTVKKGTVTSGSGKGNTYEWVTASLSSQAAYGVNIEVLSGAKVYGDKYGIKVNGNIKTPGLYSPYVHIANGAEVSAAPEANEATAVYSSGYGVFVIEGNVHGSTGVYVKGGEVSVEEGATIKSDNTTGAGIASTGKGSGIDAGGNAIAIEGNNGNYTNGGVHVEINGGTIIAGEDGYAVQNLNNAEAQENPNSVTISGGEFEGGAAGCVTIDNTNGKVDVELEGGTFTGDIATLVEAVSDKGNIITAITDIDGSGNATVVIGKKDDNDDEVAPDDSEIATWEFVNDMSNDIVKLNAENADIEKKLPDGTTTVKYLSLTGSNGFTSTVIVEEGKTLKVGQIVMDANGSIVVEAGATLVVTGANGIFAEQNSNILIYTSEGNSGTFMLSPDAKFNRNPAAIVEFTTKAYGSNWQRIGVPAVNGLKVADIVRHTAGLKMYLMYWDADVQDWKDVTSAEFILQPFQGYSFSNNAAAAGEKYDFPCNLLGNSDATLPLIGEWSSFSNSYMADVDLLELLSAAVAADAGVGGQIEIYDIGTNWWKTVTKGQLEFGTAAIKELYPIQAFILHNNTPAANTTATIDYEDAVWTPNTTPKNNIAARRSSYNNLTYATVTITAENGQSDEFTIMQSSDFTSEFENGYDAHKNLDVNPINFFATTELGEMTSVASNNVEGLALSIATKNETMFKMTFSNLIGEQLAIRDNLTGTTMVMTEDAEYFFTVAENSVSERFEIITPKNAPTSVETISNEGVKAVYTILGQYVGTTDNWNILPTGVYVVDGVKMVK